MLLDRPCDKKIHDEGTCFEAQSVPLEVEVLHLGLGVTKDSRDELLTELVSQLAVGDVESPERL